MGNKRGLTGPQNRINGREFENILEIQANHQGVLFIKMPLGARRIKPNFKNQFGLIPVKTPFDYTLVFEGHAAFLDCKRFQGSRITYSMLTEHQVDKLSAIEEHGCVAGYLIWWEDENAVSFFTAKQLAAIRPGSGISASEGEYLGTYESFALGNLFYDGSTIEKTHTN